MNKSGADVTNFVFLTTQRSGSTFIRLWLNSHPNVRCHSEIFFRRYQAADGFTFYCKANKWRRLLYSTLGKSRFSKSPYNFVIKSIIERFLHDLSTDQSFSAPWTDMTTDAWTGYQQRGKSDIEKMVGFQLMYNQLADYRPLRGWMANKKAPIIHLIRQNALKLHISSKVAQETGQYQFADKKRTRPKVFLNQTTILPVLKGIVNMQEEMKKKFPDNPYLEITYERFFSDHIEESDKIFSFLGIERAEMIVPDFLKKLNPDSLEDLIGNYDEIVRTLKGTPYQKFLD